MGWKSPSQGSPIGITRLAKTIRIHHKCEDRIEKSVLRITDWHYKARETIRIYHECEGGIEKSVPKITDWHHKACRDYKNLS